MTVAAVVAVGCAKDREFEPAYPPRQGNPNMVANGVPNGNGFGASGAPGDGFGGPLPPASAGPTNARPTGSTSAPPASTLPAAALPPASGEPVPPPAPPLTSKPGPAGTQDKPSSKEDKTDLADLFRAQDQCLSSCDQFACMKIATAYKKGTGVPKDPLAGRRYAIHACLECGAPGPGIADQCPDYQLTPKATP